MANKTQPGGASVEAYLAAIVDPARRADARAVHDLMARITGEAPRMWGTSIVGFGRYRYRYASGREGDWFLTGFSSRKRDLTLYVGPGLRGDLLARLGKHTHGKGCLYFERIADVDVGVLEDLVRAGIEDTLRLNA